MLAPSSSFLDDDADDDEFRPTDETESLDDREEYRDDRAVQVSRTLGPCATAVWRAAPARPHAVQPGRRARGVLAGGRHAPLQKRKSRS